MYNDRIFISVNLKLETKMEIEKSEIHTLYNFSFPYKDLPVEVKRLDKKTLTNVFGKIHTKIDDYEAKFLRDWYWLMRDIHEGKAFNYAKFNMNVWLSLNVPDHINSQDTENDSPKDEHWCGTVGCAWGYAQVAGIIPDNKLEFFKIEDSTCDEVVGIIRDGSRIISYDRDSEQVDIIMDDDSCGGLIDPFIIRFITSPAGYIDDNKAHDFLENNHPDIYKKIIEIANTKISSYELTEVNARKYIRLGSDYFPIEPGDVAERIAAILKYYRRKIGSPDPNRPWLNKNKAVSLSVIDKRQVIELREKYQNRRYYG